jgi:hypothetical protein
LRGEVNLGSGDAPYDSERSLLRVIHDELLLGNQPRPRPGPGGPGGPPPLPPNKPTPPTKPPTDPVPPPGVKAWDAKQFYSVGALVSFNGKVYKCIQAHQAQVDWTPTAAASLWTQVTV